MLPLGSVAVVLMRPLAMPGGNSKGKPNEALPPLSVVTPGMRPKANGGPF